MLPHYKHNVTHFSIPDGYQLLSKDILLDCEIIYLKSISKFIDFDIKSQKIRRMPSLQGYASKFILNDENLTCSFEIETRTGRIHEFNMRQDKLLLCFYYHISKTRKKLLDKLFDTID